MPMDSLQQIRCRDIGIHIGRNCRICQCLRLNRDDRMKAYVTRKKWSQNNEEKWIFKGLCYGIMSMKTLCSKTQLLQPASNLKLELRRVTLQ